MSDSPEEPPTPIDMQPYDGTDFPAIIEHIESAEVDILPVVPDGIPAPDQQWSGEIQREWIAVWENPAWAKYIIDNLHAPALRRLFSYREEWRRTYRFLEDSPMLVKGSRGNPRPNPLAARLIELEGVILKMEKEFGMTLKSASMIDMTVSETDLDWAERRKQRKK